MNSSLQMKNGPGWGGRERETNVTKAMQQLARGRIRTVEIFNYEIHIQKLGKSEIHILISNYKAETHITTIRSRNKGSLCIPWKSSLLISLLEVTTPLTSVVINSLLYFKFISI